MWAVTRSLDVPGLVHVHPLFGAEHEVDAAACWCCPERDPEEPELVVHNVAH